METIFIKEEIVDELEIGLEPYSTADSPTYSNNLLGSLIEDKNELDKSGFHFEPVYIKEEKDSLTEEGFSCLLNESEKEQENIQKSEDTPFALNPEIASHFGDPVRINEPTTIIREDNILLEPVASEFIPKNTSEEIVVQCYDCSVCDYKCNTLLKLHKHLRSNHLKEKPYNCELCEKKFPRKGDLNHHITSVHEKIKKHICAECGHGFSQRISLHKHVISIHNPIKPFECALCSYRSSRKDNLKQHINSVHTTVKPFKCSDCSFECSESFILVRHINAVHKKIKPFECNICPYKCSRKDNLTQHVRSVHAREKKYKCTLCNYSTMIPSRLNFHSLNEHFLSLSKESIPTNEKGQPLPFYACADCSFRAETKSRLINHIKMSHELNSFIKEEPTIKEHPVPTTFVGSSAQEDILDSTNIKQEVVYSVPLCPPIKEEPESNITVSTNPNNDQFACSHCSFVSTTRSHLNRHGKEVHSKFKPFQCNLCSYKCARKSNLDSHVLRVHYKMKPIKKGIYRGQKTNRNPDLTRPSLIDPLVKNSGIPQNTSLAHSSVMNFCNTFLHSLNTDVARDNSNHNFHLAVSSSRYEKNDNLSLNDLLHSPSPPLACESERDFTATKQKEQVAESTGLLLSQYLKQELIPFSAEETGQNIVDSPIFKEEKTIIFTR